MIYRHGNFLCLAARVGLGLMRGWCCRRWGLWINLARGRAASLPQHLRIITNPPYLIRYLIHAPLSS